MNILVTGASGFIGSHICKELIVKGHHVKAFYRPRADGNIPPLLHNLDVECAEGDITDIQSLEKAVEKVQIIFHAAAKLGSRGKVEDLYAITVQGTKNVLGIAQKAGIERVVHTSSVAALGVPGWKQPESRQPQEIDENHTWNYRPEWWRYGHAKYLAELEVQKSVASGLNVVIVNPGVVIGAGDINRIGGDVIIKVASNRFPISLPGGLNVVHIQDVVSGHLAAWERGRIGERYILGGENLTYLNFHQKIAEISKVKPPTHILPAAPIRALAGPLSLFSKILPVSASSLHRLGFYFFYNIQKAKAELGLAIPRPAYQAIQDAYNWYCEQGIL